MKRISLILLVLLIILSVTGCKSIIKESNSDKINLDLYYDLNSFKGIELYVWEKDGIVYCGIMSGTNRNKTDEEIENIKQNPATCEQMKSILQTYEEVEIIIVSNESQISNEDIYKALGIVNHIDTENNNDIIQIELPTNYKPMILKNYSVSNNLKTLDFNVMEGDGIPSIILKDPLEYKNKNPWLNNEDVKVLPVFINNKYNLKYHEGPLEYLTEDESIEVSLLVGKRLGIDTTKYECNNYGSSYNIFFPNKKESILWIQPSIDEIRVFFGSFDSGTNIPLPNINENDEGKLQEKYLMYYYKIYESILKMNQPILESTFECNIYGDKTYQYRIFNQYETVEDTIINYILNSTQVYINMYYSDVDNNGLSIIDLSYKQLLDSANSKEYDNTIIENLAKKNELKILGYYPLISKQDVIEKVLRKEYLSTIEYDRDINLSDIISIELIYYLVPMNKEIQPVYKVYLDLKDTMNDYDSLDKDLNSYGIFYVPAIESRYLNLKLDWRIILSSLVGHISRHSHYMS